MDLARLRIERPRHEPRLVASSPPPPRARRWGRLIALVLAAGGAWLGQDRLIELADRVRSPAVTVAAVERIAAAAPRSARGTAANGYVVATRRAALSADVPGRVVEMRVVEGDFVERGDVVARLFSEDLTAAVLRAAHEVASAQAEARRGAALVVAAEAERDRAAGAAIAAKHQAEALAATLDMATANHARVANLGGVSSRRELELAEEAMKTARARRDAGTAELAAAEAGARGAAAQLEVARAATGVASAQVAVARAGLAQATAQLSRTEVRAPFAGTIVLKDAEVGEVVSPGTSAGSSARGSICTMVERASLEVQVDLPETSLGAIQARWAAAEAANAPVRALAAVALALGVPLATRHVPLQAVRAAIYLDAFPDRPYPGRLARIWPIANRQKATIEVRIAFDSDRLDRFVRPELGARVVFTDDGEAIVGPPRDDARASPPRLGVPEVAVVRTDGVDSVFVVERDVARLRPVVVAERFAGRATLESGVREGDLVIVGPPARLADGQRVRPNVR